MSLCQILLWSCKIMEDQHQTCYTLKILFSLFFLFFCVCVWLSLYLSFLKTSPNLVHDWNILVLVRLQSVIDYVFYLGAECEHNVCRLIYFLKTNQL